MSDATASEADDWDGDELEDSDDPYSYTITDSGVNSPDTSTRGNDDYPYDPPQRGPPPSDDNFPEDDMSNAELSAIMDNYEAER